MARELIAVYVEFPHREINTYKSGKSDPVLKGYTVKKIESVKFGSAVHVVSEDDNGNVREQYFANVPFALHVKEDKNE